MSLGAVSVNLKLIFANVASILKIAFNSGEGSILDEELEIARNYLIGQYCIVKNDDDLERLKRVAALPSAFKLLISLGLKEKISLIASGGLRRSADFAKCFALGADAIYIGTAALIAVNCD